MLLFIFFKRSWVQINACFVFLFLFFPIVPCSLCYWFTLFFIFVFLVLLLGFRCLLLLLLLALLFLCSCLFVAALSLFYVCVGFWLKLNSWKLRNQGLLVLCPCNCTALGCTYWVVTAIPSSMLDMQYVSAARIDQTLKGRRLRSRLGYILVSYRSKI